MRERLPQLLLTGILALLLGAAWAQSDHHARMFGGHHGMHGGSEFERLVDHMSGRLELDDTQEQKIRNIIDAAKPEAEALRAEAQANREAMHALDVADEHYYAELQNLATRNGEVVTKLTLLHGRVMAEVSAELSDEQRAEFAEGKDRMHRRFRQYRRSLESADDTTT